MTSCEGHIIGKDDKTDCGILICYLLLIVIKSKIAGKTLQIRCEVCCGSDYTINIGCIAQRIFICRAIQSEIIDEVCPNIKDWGSYDELQIRRILALDSFYTLER